MEEVMPMENAHVKGQTILPRSEGHGYGCQKGYLVSDGGFAKAPGGKDLSKMKTQYQKFVDVVDSKQVTG
jgi:hypothetical protein